MKQTNRIRAVALVLCVLLTAAMLGGCGSSERERSSGVVEPTEQFYVADYGDVIDADTETYIVEQNQALFDQTGAQIVVVTVDFIGTWDIEEYAYTLFNEWGIGSAERNNGVLMLLVLGNDDYWIMNGYGLSSYDSDIVDLVYDNLEPDFAVGAYDAGVRKAFDAVYEKMESIYGPVDEYSYGGQISPGGTVEYTTAPRTGGIIAPIFYGVIALIAIVAIVIIGSICGLCGGGYRYHRPPRGGFWFGPGPWRGFWGGPRPPRPPRGPGPGSGPRPGGFGGPRPGGFGGSHGGFGGGGGTRGGGGGRHSR